MAHGVTPHQLADFCASGVLRRELPGVYCLTAVAASDEQRLRAALLWAGTDSIACGRSAAAWYALEWSSRRYYFDFAFLTRRTILETNGRRWHDDAIDDEHDNEKFSVPGRHGCKLVLATWDKVTRQPGALIDEIRTTLAA